MILVLFGQPNSGKTTLWKSMLNNHTTPFFGFNTEVIDGDKFRELFKNTDYTKEGRINNLNKASDIAFYIRNKPMLQYCFLAMVYPYKEARDYLRKLEPHAVFVYLEYDKERGRENYHVEDFDYPTDEECLKINTDKHTIEESKQLILDYIWKQVGIK